MTQQDQLAVLADLITSRLLRAGGAFAPYEHKPLVTAHQAAALLAVDVKTVYRHAKELGGRKVGGAWRFDLDAADEDHSADMTHRCYASERPSLPEPATSTAHRRTGKHTDRARDCQLLPVGRVCERDGAARP